MAAVVLLTASFGVACGGDSESDGGNLNKSATPSVNTRTDAPRSEPVTPSPARDGPDIKVYPVEKCELVPGGSVSGGDVVNLSLPIRNIGNTVLSSLVTVRTEGGSGLIGTQNSAVADGSAGVTTVSVAITGTEYGQQQRFTITADPEGAIGELDESNNEMTVLVDFPPAPPPEAAALACDSPAPQS